MASCSSRPSRVYSRIKQSRRLRGKTGFDAEPREMDMLADVVLRGSISEILPRLVGQ